MCFSCMGCMCNQSGFSNLRAGQKILVEAGTGLPPVQKDTELVIYEIDGLSLITTSGHCFMASDMAHITPLDEIVTNPKLEGKIARRRYNDAMRRTASRLQESVLD